MPHLARQLTHLMDRELNDPALTNRSLKVWPVECCSSRGSTGVHLHFPWPFCAHETARREPDQWVWRYGGCNFEHNWGKKKKKKDYLELFQCAQRDQLIQRVYLSILLFQQHKHEKNKTKLWSDVLFFFQDIFHLISPWQKPLQIIHSAVNVLHFNAILLRVISQVQNVMLHTWQMCHF